MWVCLLKACEPTGPAACRGAPWEMQFVKERAWGGGDRWGRQGGFRGVFCFHSGPGRRAVMDEVCRTNVTETMGNYLQFKERAGLHYDTRGKKKKKSATQRDFEIEGIKKQLKFRMNEMGGKQLTEVFTRIAWKTQFICSYCRWRYADSQPVSAGLIVVDGYANTWFNWR